ncbi:ArsA family ATPase [Haloarchaeobius amylolyticus]|uniref:ArsA family ATPase n=1 Tax=Haloarchaeobius amylolyticus TaxID=1198296 RepID=UPI0022703035|nr:TRC40/GET3/ArsA family transport-energizing ATPase [Haloarchaeobius amylolyticus]
MTDISVEAVDEVEESDDDEQSVDATDADIDVDVVDGTETTTRDDVGLDGIDAPKYVLYGGKGGVGKTTMAAATALASASDGSTTLVVSTDPAHSLSDTFETEIPAEPTQIRDDIPLYAAEIDPEVAMEQGAAVFGGGQNADDDDAGMGMGGGPGGAGGAGGPMGGLGDMLGGDGGPMEQLMGGAMPGADEAAAMQLFLQYLDDPRFDRVVVDTAPTGHTLRLLELPEIMDTMVGRMLKLRERLGGMMDGLKGMFGGQAPQEDDGMPDDLEALQEQIERLRAVLRDPTQTDFRVVMNPEEMSVFESKRLLSQLDDYGIPVGTVVVNKVMEDLADVTDDVDPDEFVKPNLDSCEFCQRRWDVQQKALAEAQEIFRGHEIKRVPLFAEEVCGERMLRIVAACLD